MWVVSLGLNLLVDLSRCSLCAKLSLSLDDWAEIEDVEKSNRAHTTIGNSEVL